MPRSARQIHLPLKGEVKNAAKMPCGCTALNSKINYVSSRVSLRRKVASCLVGRPQDASRFARHVSVSPRHTKGGCPPFYERAARPYLLRSARFAVSRKRELICRFHTLYGPSAEQHYVRTAKQRFARAPKGELPRLYNMRAPKIGARGSNNAFLQTAHTRCLRIVR